MIWLLSGYGIPRQEFINLQNDTLISLAQSLVSPDQATTNLMNYQGNSVFEVVLNSNIDLTQEPFHRSQLLSLYRFHVKEVRQWFYLSTWVLYTQATQLKYRKARMISSEIMVLQMKERRKSATLFLLAKSKTNKSRIMTTLSPCFRCSPEPGS